MKSCGTAALAAGVLALALVAGCQPRAAEAPAPTLDEMRGATYTGLDVEAPQVALTDGRWEGEPFVPDGDARPSVHLSGDFRLTGDLDADGADEAVALLAEDSGGSGEFFYLAVLDRDAGAVRNVATAPVGDRIQVRSAVVENATIHLDLVQAGPEDAACCPGALVHRSWTLGPGRLDEQPVIETGRLTLDVIGGDDWRLRAWDLDDPVPDSIEVTLAWNDGRFVGQSGCNRYFTAVTPGEMPGDVTVGDVGGTMMMCPEPVMQAESRFLSQLRDVRKFGYVSGRLALSYESDGVWGVMLFERPATNHPTDH